jgi:hypothetical protein
VVSNRKWAALTVLLAIAVPAAAQTAKPDAAAEAAAAMERARRQAAGPMRIILEASNARRKAGEPDVAASAPTPASGARPTVARAVAARPAISAAETEAASSLPVTPSAAPAETRPEPVVAVSQLRSSSVSLQGKSAAASVPGLEATGAAAQATALPATAPNLPRLAPIETRPKLLSKTEPEMAQRLLDELGSNAIVPVDLTIRADGTVAAVTLLGSVPRGLQRVLITALEQWRFEPLPRETVHRIELVFNTNR